MTCLFKVEYIYSIHRKFLTTLPKWQNTKVSECQLAQILDKVLVIVILVLYFFHNIKNVISSKTLLIWKEVNNVDNIHNI